MARSRPKIPFMMFQDVIMAVFGILILIVIYLLVNAKVSDIEFVQVLEEMREEKAALDDAVQVAEAQSDEFYDNAVKLISSRENLELRKQLEANQEQLEVFNDSIHSLLAEVSETTKNLNETISERFEQHPGVVSTREEVFKQQAEIDALKESIMTAKLDAEKTERVIATTKSYLDKIENQFRVEIDESLAGESVYLVDWSGRQFRAFRVYNGEQTDVDSNSAEDLLKKVKADSGQKRVFFFVRPDSVKEFKQALLDFRNSHIPVGYQPVPAGEELVLTKFPEGIPTERETQVGATGDVTSGRTAPPNGGATGDGMGARSGESNAEEFHVGDQSRESESLADQESGGDPASEERVESDQQISPSVTAGSGQATSVDEMADDVSVTSAGVDRLFNWWILLIVLVLSLVVIFLIMKGSRR